MPCINGGSVCRKPACRAYSTVCSRLFLQAVQWPVHALWPRLCVVAAYPFWVVSCYGRSCSPFFLDACDLIEINENVQARVRVVH